MAIRSTLFRNFERTIGDAEEFFRLRIARKDSFDRMASDLRATHDFEVNPETLRDWATRLGVHEPKRKSNGGRS